VCEVVKTDALSFRVAADTKDAITRAAAAEDRSVSYMVERILREWLVRHGHLNEEQGKI
jgi:uncharacterized protein (DUF1778 family)